MNYITATGTDSAALVAPQLFGTLFNLALYGILLSQIVWCTAAFPNDRVAIKVITYSVFSLETLQTALVIYDAFEYFAIGFGDLEQLNRARLEWIAVPIITGIVSCASQLYFAYRLYRFSNSYASSMSASVLALLQMACAVAEGARFHVLDDYRALSSETTVTCTIWLVGSALCDLILAATMVVLLMRNDTKLSSTHAMVSRLVKWIIGTGALTAFAATADLVLLLVFSKSSLHRCISVILSKVYSISLLFVQNQRAVIIRRAGEQHESFLDVGTAINFRVPPSGTYADSSSGNVVEGEIIQMQDLRPRMYVEREAAASDTSEAQTPTKSHELESP